MNEFKDFIYSNQAAFTWMLGVCFFWVLIMASNNKGIRWRISVVRFLALLSTIVWLFSGEFICGFAQYDIVLNLLAFTMVIFLEHAAIIVLA